MDLKNITWLNKGDQLRRITQGYAFRVLESLCWRSLHENASDILQRHQRFWRKLKPVVAWRDVGCFLVLVLLPYLRILFGNWYTDLKNLLGPK